MLPGRRLHQLAVRYSSAATREQIVEPLIADLQHQWLSGQSRSARTRALVHGYAAFWQTFAVCGIRATLQRVATLPSRITFERAFIGFYTISIVLVILFGVAWVRTGSFSDPTEGLKTIRGLMGLFAPGWGLGRYWRHVSGWRGRSSVLLTFAATTALGCWIYPGDPFQLALYNVLYLCVFALAQVRLARRAGS